MTTTYTAQTTPSHGEKSGLRPLPLDLLLFSAGVFLLTIEYGKIVGNLYMSDVLLALSFFAVLQRNLLRGRLLLLNIMLSRANVFLLPFGLLTFGFLVSSFRSLDMWENFTRYIQFAFIFLVLFALIFYFVNYRGVSARKILLIFFAGGFINVAVMLLFAFFGITLMDVEGRHGSLLPSYAGTYGGRYTIFGNEPNEAARLMVLPVGFIWYYVTQARPLARKMIVLVLFTAILAAVFLTVSKTGLAIILVALLMYFVVNRLRLSSAAFFAAVVTLGYVGISYLDRTILEARPLLLRVVLAWTGEDPSLTFRMESYRRVLGEVPKYMLAGLGFDNPASGIHNVLLESLVDLGGTGLVAFALFYVIPTLITWRYLQALKRSRRAPTEETLFAGGFVIGCVSLFVGDMFMTYSIERSLWFIPMLAVHTWRYSSGKAGIRRGPPPDDPPCSLAQLMTLNSLPRQHCSER